MSVAAAEPCHGGWGAGMGQGRQDAGRHAATSRGLERLGWGEGDGGDCPWLCGHLGLCGRSSWGSV